MSSSELSKYLLLFFIICLISTILSSNIGLSFKALYSKVAKYILLYFIVVGTINNKNRFRNIMIVILLSAFLLTVDAGVQYFKGCDFLRSRATYGAALQASFGNPNGFGGWLIVIVPILCGLITSNTINLRIKIGLSILPLFLITCIIATRSRASWIGFFISFVFLIVFFIRSMKIRYKILFFCTISSILVMGYFSTPQTIKTRIGSITQIQNSNLFRINLWKESLEMIEDFPVFGIGLNTYARFGPIYAKAGGGGYYPHNSYLQMAAEIGILGLAIFLWFVFKLFRLGIYAVRETNDSLLLGLLAALLAFLTQSFFDVNLYALQLVTLFWFILGLTMARINILTINKDARNY